MSDWQEQHIAEVKKYSERKAAQCKLDEAYDTLKTHFDTLHLMPEEAVGQTITKIATYYDRVTIFYSHSQYTNIVYSTDDNCGSGGYYYKPLTIPELLQVDLITESDLKPYREAEKELKGIDERQKHRDALYLATRALGIDEVRQLLEKQ